MRKWSALAAGAALAWTALIACATDYKTAVVGNVADAKAPTEASTALPPALDATVDAAADASLLDGSRPFDPSVFNAPAQVTDDFERTDLPSGGPLALTVVAGNSMQNNIQTSSCESESPDCSGNVLRFQYASSQAGAGVFMTAPVGSNSRAARFDFAARVDFANGGKGGSDVQIASFALTNHRFVFIEVQDGQVLIGDQFQTSPDNTAVYTTNENAVTTLVSGVWSKYQLYVDLDEGVVAISKDGAAYAPRTLDPQILTESFVAARIGFSYVNPDNAPGPQMYVDNLGLSQF